ncbi:serine hydrolase domain-containing protein [Aestuariibaculum sediminum]|uniref:Beta-lactamase family protein n=1 Tax=Aestuariibaculum sediminum TaxID=2770637 RepID=A0A8J6Q5B9_9FLAO|nr:serine hydrolase domain-containing protein [Aestuariibaculum sediminum]MBD0830538.1 beta-lactamase family protein [Aestuariibaculum sediminum]
MKRFIPILLLCCSLGSPKAQTLDSITLDKAKKIATDFLKTEHIPGMAISVSQCGKTILSEGFGFSNINTKTPVNPEQTIFRIASVSKSITAVTLGTLVDNDIIELNKSVYHYLPNYPKNNHDFTVKQLGGNLAGIRHYKNNKEFTLNKEMSISLGLNLFKFDPLLFKPGTKYKYSTFGYVLLSEVMQTAAETPFNKLVDSLVFKPLNMTHSFMEHTSETHKNITTFYRLNLLNKPVESKPVSNEYKVAGGGILSTSEDLIKFGNEIIYPKIISAKTRDQLTTSQRLNNGYKTGYGIGFSSQTSIKGTPKYFHTGGGIGASSIIYIFPEEEIVISILSNLSGVNMIPLGKSLENVFLK